MYKYSFLIKCLSSGSSGTTPVEIMWSRRKCLQILVGFITTIIILWCKGPAASIFYLLLIFLSLLVIETAVLENVFGIVITPSTDNASQNEGSLGIASTDTQHEPEVDAIQSIHEQEVDLIQSRCELELNLLHSRQSTISSHTNPVAMRELPETRQELFRDDATTSAQATFAPAVRDLGDQLLTPRSRRRKWSLKRPLTPVPITMMKPCRPASDRFVSPRRPLAPLNMQHQFHQSPGRPGYPLTAKYSPMLQMRGLPKPWPKSVSRSSRSGEYNVHFLTKDSCHPDSNSFIRASSSAFYSAVSSNNQ